jgi:hypothetical protein
LNSAALLGSGPGGWQSSDTTSATLTAQHCMLL